MWSSTVKNMNSITRAARLIREGPKDPEKIFEILNLPVIKVENVSLLKSAKGRKFIFKDREIYSPEVVALLHYTDIGHIGVWSEGLSLKILLNAFKKYLTKELIGLVGASDTSEKKLKDAVSVAHMSMLDYIRHEAVEDNEDIRSLRDIKLNQDEDENPCLAFEKIKNTLSPNVFNNLIQFKPKPLDCVNRERAVDRFLFSAERYDKKLKEGEMPFPYLDWIESGLGWFKTQINRHPEVNLKVSAECFYDRYMEIIRGIERDPSVIQELIIEPKMTGDKTNPDNKFCNKYTTDFSHLVLKQCDLHHVLSILSHVTPMLRWDLTLIDKDTKKLRFVEVKLDDSFTKMQLSTLEHNACDGFDLELCVINPNRIL